MHGTWGKWLCDIGWHKTELVYRDAGAAFTITQGFDVREFWVSGDIERCQRPGCKKMLILPEMRAFRRVEVEMTRKKAAARAQLVN